MLPVTTHVDLIVLSTLIDCSSLQKSRRVLIAFHWSLSNLRTRTGTSGRVGQFRNSVTVSTPSPPWLLTLMQRIISEQPGSMQSISIVEILPSPHVPIYAKRLMKDLLRLFCLGVVSCYYSAFFLAMRQMQYDPILIRHATTARSRCHPAKSPQQKPAFSLLLTLSLISAERPMENNWCTLT